MRQANKLLIVVIIISAPLALIATAIIVPLFDRAFDFNITFSPVLTIEGVIFASILIYFLYRRRD